VSSTYTAECSRCGVVKKIKGRNCCAVCLAFIYKNHLEADYPTVKELKAKEQGNA